MYGKCEKWEPHSFQVTFEGFSMKFKSFVGKRAMQSQVFPILPSELYCKNIVIEVNFLFFMNDFISVQEALPTISGWYLVVTPNNTFEAYCKIKKGTPTWLVFSDVIISHWKQSRK